MKGIKVCSFGFVLFALCQFFLASYALAQLTISSPNGEEVAAARDYATEVLGNPWDMGDEGDLAGHIYTSDYFNLWPFNHTGGKFNATVAGSLPYFYMLSPGQCSANNIGKTGQGFPIDTSIYRYLTVNFSDVSDRSEMRVLWHRGCSYGSDFVQTEPVGVEAGPQTITIDLDSIAHESSNGGDNTWTAEGEVTGLRIFPTLASTGATFSIDSIQLTNDPGSAGEHSVNHSFTASGNNTHYSLWVDTNSTPFDGFVTSLVSAASSTTSSTMSSRVLFPGSYNVVGFTHDDQGTLNGTPCDFDESGDVGQTSALTVNSSSYSNGTVTATSTSDDPWLVLRCFGSSINTSAFNQFTVRMNLGDSGKASLFWFDTNGSLAGSHFFDVSAGDNTYNIDLSGVASWSGTVGKLRLDPTNRSSSSIVVHHAALSSSRDINSEDDLTPTIQVSPGSLSVNSPPSLSILQPDNRGGVDYATSVLGNAWDYADINDIGGTISGTQSAQILPDNEESGLVGNFFCATNRDGDNDPYQESLNVAATASDRIDTTRFKNVIYKVNLEREQDVVNGSTVRIIWRSQADGDTGFQNGDDTFLLRGDWHEYVQDTDDIQLEAVLHPNPSDPVWHGDLDYFRIDMHEFVEETRYCMDYVKITADDESDETYTIAYSLNDSDDSEDDVLVSFYYNTSASTSGGTLIAQNLAMSRESRVLQWDTSALSNGTYYVYAIVTDGSNTYRRLASGPVVVNHSLSAEASGDPVLEVDFPQDDNTFSNTLVVQGSAADNVQIALIEFLLDGELIGTTTPSLFDSEFFADNPLLADASNSGFRSSLSTSSFSNGDHSLEIIAYDTAGNQSTVTRSISKVSSGADTPPDAPAAGDADAIDVAASLDITKVVAKRRKLVIKVENNGCAAGRTVFLLAGSSLSTVRDDPGNAQVLKAITMEENVDRIIFKRKKPKGFKGGRVYFSVTCGTQANVADTADVSTAALKGRVKKISKWAKKIRGNLKAKQIQAVEEGSE